MKFVNFVKYRDLDRIASARPAHVAYADGLRAQGKLAIGAAAMLGGAQVITVDARVTGLWLGVLTAVLLIVFGVATSVVPELLVGTAGAFQWAPQFALYYLADAFGADVALFVVGAFLLAAAALLTRTYRHVLGEGQRQSPTSVGTSDSSTNHRRTGESK